MVVRIAVVEDETDQYLYYRKLIETWSKVNNVEVSIRHVASAEEYLFQYKQQDAFDLLFLDICMKDMNGMELAREIRKYDRSVPIIFVTGASEYVYEGYEIGAVRYLLKPLDEKKLDEALNACMGELKNQIEDYISFPYCGENRKLSKNDIISIQVEGHYLKMQTTDQRYEWKASLKEMLARLGSDRFVLVNRSVAVNLSFVEKITREVCVLENGEMIPVSRGAYNAINDAFIRYFYSS